MVPTPTIKGIEIEEPYGIRYHVEPDKSLVCARIEGVLSVEDTRRFGYEEQKAVRQLGFCPDGYGLLVDLTDYAIQK